MKSREAMQKELKIAKEKIVNATTGRAKFWHKAIAKEHLASCQRFLKFLKEWECSEMILGQGQPEINPLWKWLSDKKTELQKTVKEYKEGGIN